MKEISKKEMMSVEGGASPILITSIITTIISFIVGIVSGYSNPKKCN